MIDRGGEQRVVIDRLIFHADFILRRILRLERLAEQIGALLRREALDEAGIGRQAILEQVGHADTTGEGAVLEGLGRVGQQIVGIEIDPAVAAAQRHDPVVQLDLVLNINAGLGQGLLVREIRCCRQDGTGIDRIDEVDRRGSPVVILELIHAAAVIEAEQHGVAHAREIEARLQLVVDGSLGEIVGGGPDIAVQRAIIGREAVRRDRLVIHADLEIARGLAEGEGVVEAVRQGVADRELFLVELVEARFAEHHIGAPDRLVGEGVEQRRALVLHVIGQEGDLGLVALPGQRRRDEQPVVLLRGAVIIVELGVGIARQAGQAEQQAAILIGLAAHVEGALEMVPAAGLDLHFLAHIGVRPLGGAVDDAARLRLAVQRPAGAAHDVDTLDGVRLRRVGGKSVAVHAQTVAERPGGRGIEAANGDRIIAARIDAVIIDGHAGRIAHGLRHGLGTAILHLLTADGRDRLRGLDGRRVRLGRRHREIGDIAFRRLVGGDAAQRLDIDRRQLDRLLVLALLLRLLVLREARLRQRQAQQQRRAPHQRRPPF